MSDAVWTGTVIERMGFMDAHSVDKQPMGLPWYNPVTVYIILEQYQCVMLREKKQLDVCPRRCRLVRGEKGASRARLFTPGCLPVTECFKRRG